jgi:hypothetical protein
MSVSWNVIANSERVRPTSSTTASVSCSVVVPSGRMVTVANRGSSSTCSSVSRCTRRPIRNIVSAWSKRCTIPRRITSTTFLPVLILMAKPFLTSRDGIRDEASRGSEQPAGAEWRACRGEG